MYAIYLADITNTPAGSDIGIRLLLQPILSRQIIQVDPGRFDAMAAVLNCDDGRGQAIHEIIRMKYKKYQLRMAYSKTGKGGWKSI